MYRSVFRSAPRTAPVAALGDEGSARRGSVLDQRAHAPPSPRRTTTHKRSSAGSAAVTGIQLGDDTAALTARLRLEPLLAVIDDPYLEAVSQLAVGMELAHRRRLRRRATRSVPVP